MTRDDLVMAVDRVRLKLKLPQYEDTFKRNESFVRYVLVDPVLQALGWNTEDPALVQVEYNVKDDWLRGPCADYALMAGRDKPLVFIEVKTLGGKLDDAVEQCKKDIKNCIHGDVSSFIVTDGQIYRRYSIVSKQNQKIAEVDILVADTNQVVQGLLNVIGTPVSIAMAAGQVDT
jgi:predicted type IV restriction endonuclease